MAKIEKLKKGTATIYPATIPHAVVDPTSAKSVRTELDEKANHGYESNPKSLKEVDDEKAEHGYAVEETPKTLKQVDDEVSQLAGELNQADAKIKDIENILSTSNPSQSARISVSGVSPLALPKNASNGGMSIKLEGLTDAGVNFTPTGRVRSVGKNLFDKGRVTAGKYINPSVGISSNALFLMSDFIRINPTLAYKLRGVTATVSATQTTVGYYDDNKAFISGQMLLLSTLPVLTIPATARYLIFSIFPADINTAQLERASISTTYEPYKETNLYLAAPELRSNGAVKDEIRKGANGYELVKRISDVDGTVLATPVISPISYGGVLNSAENGTVYHEPVIADAGVYGTNMPILLTDYPISALEEIIKHENGVDTYLDVSTAVIAGDKLSFTHPSLQSGDLVLFTYAFAKESTNGNITATFYDSNVVKIDTVTGKAYRINEVVTNGVLTRTLTEV